MGKIDLHGLFPFIREKFMVLYGNKLLKEGKNNDYWTLRRDRIFYDTYCRDSGFCTYLVQKLQIRRA